MFPHLLTNLKIQRYYQNESRFNGVYSCDNFLDNIRSGAYVVSFDEYADFGTHWIVMDSNGNKITYLIVLESKTFHKKSKFHRKIYNHNKYF